MKRKRMADWSTLPKDLLLLIVDSLQSPIDVLRLRSVCSSWRHTVQPNRRSVHNYFPYSGIFNTPWGFGLSKRTIYRISIPDASPSEWIVKISEDASGRKQLMNPISGKPLTFLGNLDLLKIRVFQLGEEYLMNPLATSSRYSGFLDETGVFRLTDAGFEILTVDYGSLEMYASVDKKWKEVVKEMDFHSPYSNVTLFKSKFYAVDKTGRTVMVDSATNIELVAESVILGGGIKYLVQSNGSLLLVDKLLTLKMDLGGFQDDDDDDDGEDFDEKYLRLLKQRTYSVEFKVYKLVESEKKWEEMESLGDQILFLGSSCRFSASATDISGYEGNCIYFDFSGNVGNDGTSESQATDVAVYHLHSNKLEPLTAESKLWKLFCPPSAWLSNTWDGREDTEQE